MNYFIYTKYFPVNFMINKGCIIAGIVKKKLKDVYL